MNDHVHLQINLSAKTSLKENMIFQITPLSDVLKHPMP
jgi:REP element-mobilizing transposase RayT